MDDDDYAGQPAPAMLMAASGWQPTLIIGVITLILGIIVTIHPSGSLTVIAVLLGVLAILSGIFQLARAFGRAEQHRAWRGISGLLFIVIGVVLIRHLDLTVAAIGLFVGITWIVQGIAELMAAFSGRAGGAWWVLFGAISLIAGIVVVAAPVSSVTVLAVLLGIWFIVMGLLEIGGALLVRHALSAAAPGSSAGEAQRPSAPRSA
jgi:uncharacterized membrane protein HdeD (DUF308 family)